MARPIAAHSRSLVPTQPISKVACSASSANRKPGRACTDVTSSGGGWRKSVRALPKEDRTDLRIAHVDRRRRRDPDRKGALDRIARANGFEPALDMRKLRQVLALPLRKPHPADASHIGD